MSELPNISLVTILHEWNEFTPLFKYHWETIDYPKDKLEWIIIDDTKDDYSDTLPVDDNILYIKVSSSEYLEKINFPKDDEKIVWNYFSKMKKLPNGFKRDYAVGMTSYDYIFHLDCDTLYQPNCIQRKLKFLKQHKLDCVYCKAMLCYDIYGKELYKTENKVAGYESTLFHTKKFWEKGGFKWEDIESEAVSFYYNKGLDRKMDNYYDTIKILSVHNINKYNVMKVSFENMDIKIPSIVNELNISQHPLKYELKDLFYEESMNVLGINSEIMDGIKDEKWDSFNISYNKKEKEKSLIQNIQKLKKDFKICFLNTKFPIWNIFDKISFDCIVLESQKNLEQMDSILKKKEYIRFENIYINKTFLLG